MAVGGGPENNLKQNEDAESGHGREQGIPLDIKFSVEPLLAQPEKSEENGASLENVNRPGLHCAEGEWTEHQKAERCVKQDCSNLSRSLLAADPHRLSCMKTHRVQSSAIGPLRRFFGEVQVVDPELTTDGTALWKPPDV